MNSNALFLSLFFLVTYFVSSISFALLISQCKGVDLRRVGSGNLGATNVYRAMGIQYAVIVFLLDALKGALLTYLSMIIFENPWIHVGVGLMSIVGHSLSCFVNFKGGKSVATSIGVLCALNVFLGLSIFLLGMSIIKITKYVSLASISCAILAPILFYAVNAPVEYVSLLTVIAIFIILRHKANILRLLKGEEHKI